MIFSVSPMFVLHNNFSSSLLIYVRLFEVDGRTGHQLSNCVAIYSENQLHFDALVITLSVITGLRIFHDYLPKRGCMSW